MEKAAAPERRLLLRTLGDDLTARVLGAADFDEEVSAIIGEFRDLGHDLYLFDSDGEFQIWCGDWIRPAAATKLVLEFYPGRGVEASWSEADGQ